MFIAPVESVSATRIFVAPVGVHNRQCIVYANSVQSAKTNAMILPVPTQNGGADIDVSVSFDKYTKFFSHLHDAFEASLEPMFASRGGELKSFGAVVAASANFLAVTQQGNFDISIAPTAADLLRVHPDLIDRETVSALSIVLAEYDYRFAFVVAKFNASRAGATKFHPLCVLSPMLPVRSATQQVEHAIFIPTKHFHGHIEAGDAHDWDHVIYTLNTDSRGQEAGANTKLVRYEQIERIFDFVDYGKLPAALTDSFDWRMVNRHEFMRLTKKGTAPNIDLVLFPHFKPLTRDAATTASKPVATTATLYPAPMHM
jgi:hypothetical protein